ncbi:hypothetical protein TCAL_01743 [Tigriopus californicus]|uniref:Vang-like protein n=1 Tax=Tigriopus californicus TaxID=6832 RepID=A0A553PM81_TIGCA|nr:vang-like protein 1 [Tigriopus californicus]TRY78777.1 hypothetical protein TCAL_01743 [Tigriopus californicus]
MPILGAVVMDTDRIIPKKGSPDSGVHGANSSNGSLTHGFVPAQTSAMARKKKSERIAPTLNHAGLIREASMNELNHFRNEQDMLMQSDLGLTNLGYSQDHSVMSSINDSNRLNATRETNADSDELQEVIEVQILPQDDNWGETATAVTNASDLDYAQGGESMDKWKMDSGGRGLRCQRYFMTTFVTLISFLAFISPILMVSLPSFGILDLREQQLYCGVECDGMLVSLAFKIFVLAAGSWAMFARQSRATLPRIRIFRSLVCLLIIIFLVSFWLFYLHHVYTEKEVVHYKGLVQFALNLMDALLFVHYLAILLMEIRHQEPRYYIKILRSPDGESKGFLIGQMSIQRAASWVLDKYYTEFSLYNPFLDRILNNQGSRNRKSVKVYDVDGAGTNVNDCNSTVVSVASKRGHHQDRLMEEYEHNRKVEKRKARLLGAAEEAFTHIRRIRPNQSGEKSPMEPYDAAQAIFPTLARPLQKYLRATRQQPRHTMESILKHLSTCLSYDLSPRAFLERYLVTSPVLQSDKESSRELQRWSLVCEKSLYRELEPGVSFQLRQGEVSLMCQIQRLPHLYMSEEIIDPSSNRFVLRINSETSV